MKTNYLEPIDYMANDFPDYFDELPLWSARFGSMLLDHVPLRTGITILDVGCGTGFLSLELAQRCGEDSRVIAVDPWSSATSRLRRKISKNAIQNIEVRTEDIVGLELPSDSVDLIVSNLGINNFADPLGAMQTCFRVAKSDASFLLTTNLLGHFREFYDVVFELLEQAHDSASIEKWKTHIQHRATTAGVAELLSEAGFETIRMDESSYQERFANGTAFLKHQFIRLAFVQDWKHLFPATQAREFFSALENTLNQRAASCSGLSFTVPMACITAKKTTE